MWSVSTSLELAIGSCAAQVAGALPALGASGALPALALPASGALPALGVASAHQN